MSRRIVDRETRAAMRVDNPFIPAEFRDLSRELRVDPASSGSPDGEGKRMSDDQVAPKSAGVEVELLATVDLGPEIGGMDGRQLRMRMVTIGPGGVFGPVHDHPGRPGVFCQLGSGRLSVNFPASVAGLPAV